MPREKNYYAIKELSSMRQEWLAAAFKRHKLRLDSFEQAGVKNDEFIVIGKTYQLTIYGSLDSEILWNSQNPNRGDYVSR